MRIYKFKKASLPKIAVLATGLTVAILVGTLSPQAAQATPTKQEDCTNCHDGGSGVMQLSWFGPTTMAASADYGFMINMSADVNSGQSGWWIANSDESGATGTTANVCRDAFGTVPAIAPACYGGPALSQSFPVRLTAPATAGTFYYKVFIVHGKPSAPETYTKTFSITVLAPATTEPPVTTTTEPPVTTTTEPPVTTTTEPPVTTTTEPPVTTTTEPPVTTTTEPPVTTTTEPPVTTTEPPVTTTTEPPVTTTEPPVTTTEPPVTTTEPPVTTTTEEATTEPGAPTDVRATAGNGQATVSWTAPESDGGLPVVGYMVIANGDEAFEITEGAETTMTVTGLTNGRSYTFTVIAFNEGDNDGSLESAASNAVTPSGPSTSTGSATTPVVPGDGAGVIPVGSPDTGAGGASNPADGPQAGLGGLTLLIAGAGATQLIRRRRQV